MFCCLSFRSFGNRVSPFGLVSSGFFNFSSIISLTDLTISLVIPVSSKLIQSFFSSIAMSYSSAFDVIKIVLLHTVYGLNGSNLCFPLMSCIQVRCQVTMLNMFIHTLHSRKDITFLSLVEDHPGFPKNVCKNLLNYTYDRLLNINPTRVVFFCHSYSHAGINLLINIDLNNK